MPIPKREKRRCAHPTNLSKLDRMTPTQQTQQLLLPVHGMTCPSCVSQVENALRKLPGVSSVKVDLETSRALLTYDPAVIGLLDMQKAVLDAGYTVPADQITLQIAGMHCVSCLAHVEGALQDLPGVLEASVSLSQAKAQVQYIHSIVTPSQMEAAVRDAGYAAHAQVLDQNTAVQEYRQQKSAPSTQGGKQQAGEPGNLIAWLRKTLQKPGSKIE